MADSEFIKAWNPGNAAFQKAAGEDFMVAKGAKTGRYTAISIDEMKTGALSKPGGVIGDNTVVLYVSNEIMDRSGIVKDTTILVVRGERVRVNEIAVDDDDSSSLFCGTTGLSV